MTATPIPRTDKPLTGSAAGPHLVGTDRLRDDVGRRPVTDVGRQVIHRLVLLQRLELAGGDAQHGAALEQLTDAQAVALDERVHLLARAMDDDVDRRGSRPQVIRQVGAESRLVGRGGRGRSSEREGDEEGQRHQEGTAGA